MKTQNEVKPVEHTPTPWKIVNGSEIVGMYQGRDTYLIPAPLHFVSPEVHRANVKFIVRAVNSYEALLEAAKDAITILGRMRAFGNEIGPDVCKEQFAVIKRGLERAVTQAEGR